VRELGPETLITGRGDPIVGAELIDAALERLHGAVDFVHRRAVEGFNEGADVWTLMDRIQLPAHLRVGEGYGKVAWAVRTIWESYIGWFKLSSTTELYPDSVPAALAELVDLAGAEAVLERAEAALAHGEALVAIRLGEAVGPALPGSDRVAALMIGAHRHLLETGGDVSFWENGWLLSQIRHWESGPDGLPGQGSPRSS
jgi:alkyl sulfatase BDS1-like metallo-beta-lactamase superfamily hydrolase